MGDRRGLLRAARVAVRDPRAVRRSCFGILGLREIKAHPEKRGKGRAITGIVLGSLVTLGFVLIVLAATPRSHGY